MNKTPDERNLRKRTSRLLNELSVDVAGHSELRSVFEDVHLYQAELETQNQELLEIQQRLEVARQKFTRLFDLAPVGFVTVTQEGVILDINLMASELLGFARLHIESGKTPMIGAFAGASHAAFFELLKHSDPPGKNRSANLWTVGRQTEPRLLTVYASECHDEQSTSACLLCLIDCTARYKAEAELAEKSRKLEEQNRDLIRFNQVAVGREMRMIELKREINELCGKLNEQPRYLL